MPGFLQTLASLLGWEPAPGSPEQREEYCRCVKARNDELRKPPGQRDEARVLQLTKRVLSLRILLCQVCGVWGIRQVALGCPGAPRRGVHVTASPHPPPTAGKLVWLSPHTTLPLHLQAVKERQRRSVEVMLQRPDLGCCRDCVRVQQRVAASRQAYAVWNEQWEAVSTLRLQALEQGQPYPPLTLPWLEVQPYLPEGVPEELPPSIDRCAACQKQLDEVRRLLAWRCTRPAHAVGWGAPVQPSSRGFGGSSMGWQQQGCSERRYCLVLCP